MTEFEIIQTVGVIDNTVSSKFVFWMTTIFTVVMAYQYIGSIIKKLQYITIVLIMSVMTSTVFALSDNDLPAILDYYPNCSYQIIKSSTSQLKTDDPSNTEVNARLLNVLRKDAQKNDADAIILTSKKVSKYVKNSRSLDGSLYYTYMLSYKGEFIKQCQETNSEKRKPARYNHLGNRTLEINRGSVQFSTSTIIAQNRMEEYKNPQIENKEVSLDNGIYGLQMGARLAQVILKLGKPNVILDGIAKETVVGYGRHHWFHFQDDILVKFQSEFQLLSTDILNSVPMLDFFDGYKWLIDNKINYKSSLKDVKRILNIDTKLNDNNQLQLRDDNHTLTLNFLTINEHRYSEENFVLNGFTIESNAYIPTTLLIMDNNLTVPDKSKFDAINQVYTKIQNKELVNWDEISLSLGNPVGHITLSNDSNITLYSPNLLFITKDSNLLSINILEGSFIADNKRQSKIIPWQLGHYQHGQTLKETRPFLPESAFEYDNKVEIDNERFSLILFFYDINGKNILYQSELKIKPL